jgi:hypothetical protein
MVTIVQFNGAATSLQSTFRQSSGNGILQLGLPNDLIFIDFDRANSAVDLFAFMPTFCMAANDLNYRCSLKKVPVGTIMHHSFTGFLCRDISDGDFALKMKVNTLEGELCAFMLSIVMIKHLSTAENINECDAVHEQGWKELLQVCVLLGVQSQFR